MCMYILFIYLDYVMLFIRKFEKCRNMFVVYVIGVCGQLRNFRGYLFGVFMDKMNCIAGFEVIKFFCFQELDC